jgi:hypothetical protein
MQVKKYFYKTADFFNKDKKARYISETLENRNSYMNEVFYKLYKKDIDSFKTTGKTALLYIAGACEHHSASRDCIQVLKGAMPVKSQLGYIASKLAKRIGNISYLSINANACASSLYALKEAKELLNQGFDDVLIYGEEWVEEVELMLFKQLNIDLVCSDGIFIIQLTKECQEPKAYIGDVSWVWSDDRSPFEVTKDGYKKAMEQFKIYNIDMIKMHGSGTEQNTTAEDEAINELFGNIDRIEYKSKIGHSQGVSAVVEICKLMDEYQNKSVLVNASGLGNFYGSCYVRL